MLHVDQSSRLDPIRPLPRDASPCVKAENTVTRNPSHRQHGPRAIRPFNLNVSMPGLWCRMVKLLSFVLTFTLPKATCQLRTL